MHQEPTSKKRKREVTSVDDHENNDSQSQLQENADLDKEIINKGEKILVYNYNQPNRKKRKRKRKKSKKAKESGKDTDTN